MKFHLFYSDVRNENQTVIHIEKYCPRARSWSPAATLEFDIVEYAVIHRYDKLIFIGGVMCQTQILSNVSESENE